MSGNASQYSFEGKHIIIRYAGIIPFDRRKEMKIRTLLQFCFDFAWRESFVSNNDPFANVIITDKRRLGTGINTVSRKYFGTNRFHPLDVIGI